jgi:hypothetical protein
MSGPFSTTIMQHKRYILAQIYLTLCTGSGQPYDDPTTTSAASGNNDWRETQNTKNESLEEWRFTVLGGVDSQTMQHYGGRNNTIQLLMEGIDYVNFKFAGHFERDIVFQVDELFTLEDSTSKHIDYPHPNHDYLLLITGIPGTTGGGWYGHVQTIHHAWSWDGWGGTFAQTAMDGLTHEFAHTRGCIDVYALKVKAENNPITNKEYKGETSIMNYPYGESVWDDHCVATVNYQADEAPTKLKFIQDFWPPYLIFDLGVPNATIQLYGISWFSNTVDSYATEIYFSDDSGTVTIDMHENNIFQPVDTGQPWLIAIPNFVVRVENQVSNPIEGEVLFDMFFPFTKANMYAFSYPGQNYTVFELGWSTIQPTLAPTTTIEPSLGPTPKLSSMEPTLAPTTTIEPSLGPTPKLSSMEPTLAPTTTIEPSLGPTPELSSMEPTVTETPSTQMPSSSGIHSLRTKSLSAVRVCCFLVATIHLVHLANT